MLAAVWWGGYAAASLLIGYAFATRGLSSWTIGRVMGLGANALISAMACELIPESAFGGPGMSIAFGLDTHTAPSCGCGVRS